MTSTVAWRYLSLIRYQPKPSPSGITWQMQQKRQRTEQSWAQAQQEEHRNNMFALSVRRCSFSWSCLHIQSHRNPCQWKATFPVKSFFLHCTHVTSVYTAHLYYQFSPFEASVYSRFVFLLQSLAEGKPVTCNSMSARAWLHCWSLAWPAHRFTNNVLMNIDTVKTVWNKCCLQNRQKGATKHINFNWQHARKPALSHLWKSIHPFSVNLRLFLIKVAGQWPIKGHTLLAHSPTGI